QVHSKSRTTPRRSLSGYPDFQVGEEVIEEYFALLSILVHENIHRSSPLKVLSEEQASYFWKSAFELCTDEKSNSKLSSIKKHSGKVKIKGLRIIFESKGEKVGSYGYLDEFAAHYMSSAIVGFHCKQIACFPDFRTGQLLSFYAYKIGNNSDVQTQGMRILDGHAKTLEFFQDYLAGNVPLELVRGRSHEFALRSMMCSTGIRALVSGQIPGIEVIMTALYEPMPT
ncbi:hypothetical protein GOV09_07245, partial [Candidatus Woesearchaeota archaeon]|nr:hypothetical protein [Candidatus Woesearchaeota archaeon]